MNRDELIKLGIIKPNPSETEQESINARASIDEGHMFHNPYHFVPVKEPDFNKEGLKWLDIEKGEGASRQGKLRNRIKHEGFSHDKYLPDRFHGRIICTLTTKTPIFVGARRISDGTDSEPARIAPFELEGRPAIPASTLRGMISSVLEAASNSALRVLEKRVLSRRADMRESLGAIGMLVKKENGEMGILPLTLPPLKVKRRDECNGREDYELADDWQKWTEIFKKYPAFPVYVDGYEPDGRDKIKYENGRFLEKNKPRSWSAANQEFWYAGVPNVSVKDNKIHVQNSKTRKTRHSCFILGHNVVVDPQRQAAKGHIRGILRVLGIEEREKKIPIRVKNNKVLGKKHEMFIPFPEDEKCRNDVLDVEDALKRFHMMADERADKEGKYPFELKGMKRSWVDDKNTVRLKEKDLVFFDAEKEGDKYVVSRISLSSIWRMDYGGTVHDCFSGIDPELLPFNHKRKKVSPAELILGFVEECKDESKREGDTALAYAGRIRFSHGILKEEDGADTPYMREVTLKILDSPKPPCPCMYFYDKQDPKKFISKNSFKVQKTQGDHDPIYLPKGRKFYLHHNLDIEKQFGRKVQNGRTLQPWETHPKNKKSRLKQKARIKPVRENRTYTFHIDFDNLCETELGLLLYSLSPKDTFLHKIGMGKPLGLGSVAIKVDELRLVERRSRYLNQDPFEGAEARYSDTKQQRFMKVFEKCRKNDLEEVLKALEQLGDPKMVKARVHTPLTKGQKDEKEEIDTYRWFKDASEQLSTLPANSLPTLKRI